MAGGSGLTRGAVSLTHRSIEALRPAEVPYRISDQRCVGLAVRVPPSGIKTWDLAFRIRGSAKVRRVSLGRVADLSLERARDRANELTSAARAGRDLIAEEEENRAAAARRLTIEKLIEFYVRRRVAGRLRTAKEIESRLKRTLRQFCTGAPTTSAGATFGNYWTLSPTGVSSAKLRSADRRSARCFGGHCRRTSWRQTPPPD